MHEIYKHNPTTRFSDRAKVYVAYRPNYPVSAINYLEEKKVLFQNCQIADLGAGTGIFAKLLLDKGYSVTCVEPNKEMAEEGMLFLTGYNTSSWVNGSAENTNLATQSQDVIVCAQAFHWFEPTATRKELSRVLRPDGNLVLIWNSRKSDANDFMKEYKEIAKKYGKEYNKIQETQSDDKSIAQFYGHEPEKVTFDNFQELSCEALIGRVFSSSYMPSETSLERKLAEQELEYLFTRHNKSGFVRFEYETRMYVGQLR